MKKRKPQPSPVGVVFRGHHERAGWSWADAMRARERNADAEKAGPENAVAQPPWGWRGRAMWMGGGLGAMQTRLFALQAERRSWREGCLRTGALTARTSAKVRISSQRDSEAAGWHTRRNYMSMNRAVGAKGPAGGRVGGHDYVRVTCQRETTKGAALIYVVCYPGSTPACQRSRVADVHFAGSADSFPAQSRQREANESDSSTAERSARAATRWVHGRARQTPHAAWRRSVRPIWFYQ